MRLSYQQSLNCMTGKLEWSIKEIYIEYLDIFRHFLFK